MHSPCHRNLSPRYFSFYFQSRLKSHILPFHVTKMIINSLVGTGMIRELQSSLPCYLFRLCIWFVLANCHSSSCSSVIALLPSSFASSDAISSSHLPDVCAASLSWPPVITSLRNLQAARMSLVNQSISEHMCIPCPVFDGDPDVRSVYLHSFFEFSAHVCWHPIHGFQYCVNFESFRHRTQIIQEATVRRAALTILENLVVRPCRDRNFWS